MELTPQELARRKRRLRELQSPGHQAAARRTADREAPPACPGAPLAARPEPAAPGVADRREHAAHSK